MGDKKWTQQKPNEAVVKKLKNDLKINRIFCELLTLRGITDYKTAKNFFRPSLSQLHDPFLMKGMTTAVKRLQKAIHQKEKIMIYGDYDVDGTTSVALLYHFLKKNFPELPLIYYIPDRYKEGYGISNRGIEHAKQTGCTLMVAIDCGIRAVQQADLAAEKGIDLIICDHHLPGEQLPKTLAILNPKQKGCAYPYKELSGCGIGFKLITAIAKAQQLSSEIVFQYLDLLATSIAADIVPVTGENRILAYFGLKKLNENPCLPLQKIQAAAELKRTMTMRDIGFVIAPRINAVGRLDHGKKVVALLIENNPEAAAEKALFLNDCNLARQEKDKKITEEALAMIEADKDKNKKATVLFQPHWHKGVVGIVAARVLEQYYRPTLILTESNGEITGSGRSVNGFNLHHALQQCAPLLTKFGGHFFAAGLSMKPAQLPAFKQQFELVVSQSIPHDSLQEEILIEAELSLTAVRPKFFNILKQFEPFGPKNPSPIFLSKKVMDYQGQSRIVKEKHIRFMVQQPESSFVSGIGFGLAHKFNIIKSGRPFDLIYTISENEWQGRKHLQMNVLDIREAK